MVKRDSSSDILSLDEPLRHLLKIVQENSGKSIGEVVEKASMKLRLKRYEAAKLLYRLKELNLIYLMDPRPPKSFINYLFSSHVIWFWLLTISIMLTLIFIYLTPQTPPFIYLRYVFGLLFVLYLPGAALIELLYPKPSSLSQLERLALSIGLSLASVPLVGLILNYTPWGIRLDPIIVSLSTLTLALSLGAAARKFFLLRLELVARRNPER